LARVKGYLHAVSLYQEKKGLVSDVFVSVFIALLIALDALLRTKLFSAAFVLINKYDWGCTIKSFLLQFLIFVMNTAIAIGVIYAFAKIVLNY
jgi:hypothetical protein